MPVTIFGQEGARPINRSGFINSVGVSQLVMSMWDNRAEAWVHNPSTASFWINTYSLTAAIDTPSNIEVPQGTGWYFCGMNSDAAVAAATYSNAAASVLRGSSTIGNVSSAAGGAALVLITPSVSFGTWPDVTGVAVTEAAAGRGTVPILRAA